MSCSRNQFKVSTTTLPIKRQTIKDMARSFQAVTDMLQECHNVLVLAGAGLSVSCGIPDFRSKDGLYATLNANELGLETAEDLFDIHAFQENPRPFYRFAKKLHPGSVNPSFSHFFLQKMEQTGKLLRLYTQNIDGLEEAAGVSRKKVVYAHGSLTWAHCMKCGTRVSSSEIQDDVMKGVVPRCKQPLQHQGRRRQRTDKEEQPEDGSPETTADNRLTRKRQKSNQEDDEAPYEEEKTSGSVPTASDSEQSSPPAPAEQPESPKRIRRSRRASSSSIRVSVVDNQNEEQYCHGVMKPGVTFFGEKLQDTVSRCLEADNEKVDAVIVIGTSLSVAPMSRVINYLSPSVPRILINRNHVYPPGMPRSANCPEESIHDDGPAEDNEDVDFRRDYVFDAVLLGNCDEVTKALAHRLGWTKVGKDHGKGEDSSKDQNAEPRHFGERTFVFPGGVISESEKEDEDEVTIGEVVHCDGCSQEINETVMKCTTCFDFDLCCKCYHSEKILSGHFDGKHSFQAEELV